MKKYMFLAVAAIVALASCNNASPKMDDQPAADSTGGAGLKIAYVEVDSLMTQYEFCKDFTLVLQKKSNNARNTLNQKGQQLQNAMNNFQQKMNNNGFTSREQAESQQAAIQRQQNDLQQLQARLENELANETATYNEGLYAAKRFDITNDVINGLNKAYKSTFKKTEEKKEEKK